MVDFRMAKTTRTVHLVVFDDPKNTRTIINGDDYSITGISSLCGHKLRYADETNTYDYAKHYLTKSIDLHPMWIGSSAYNHVLCSTCVEHVRDPLFQATQLEL